VQGEAPPVHPEILVTGEKVLILSEGKETR
jgi:hypothetical protein